jgi:HPt (histidine-containing phosphotransfer) domain-containing protein
MSLSDFSPELRDHLFNMGLCVEQIARLRDVLESIKLVHTQFAAHDDVKALLKKVESQSRRLAHTLKKLSWSAQPKELLKYAEALSIVCSCLPGLNASTEPLRQSLESLASNLREQLENPPQKPRRHRTTSQVVIGFIDRALRSGWTEAHPSGTPAYPRKLRVSAHEIGDRGGFLEVVHVCYEAAGVTGDPVRSIRSYMKNPLGRS